MSDRHPLEYDCCDEHEWAGLGLCPYCRIAALEAELDYPHQEIYELMAERDRLRAALEQIRDFDFEQECLPECGDGYHADLCPWANEASVMVHIATQTLEAGEGDT